MTPPTTRNRTTIPTLVSSGSIRACTRARQQRGPLDPSTNRPPLGVVVAASSALAAALGGDALQPGDVIHAVNRSPVGGLTALRGALDRIGSGQVVVLQVERASELLFLTFTVDR